MATPYDVIVVGARCAGSPTAMLLAQKGYRVLVVDRATFPSDTVSTHFIHPPGVAVAPALGAARRRARERLPARHHLLVRLRAVQDLGIAAALRRHGAGVRPAPHRARQDPRRRRRRRRCRGARAVHRPGDRHRRRRARHRHPAGTTPAARTSPRRRRSSSVPTAGTRSSPRPSSPSSTTSGRRSRGTTTRTGATCRSTGSSVSSARTTDGPRFPPTTTRRWSSPGVAHALFDDYHHNVESTYFSLFDSAPEFAERIRGANARSALHRHRRSAELLPQAVRPRLGARRRRGLPQGPAHRVRHHRRVPRRRAPRRRARSVVQRRRARSTTRCRTTSSSATKRRCRCSSSRASSPRWSRHLRRCKRCFGAMHGNQEAMDGFVSVMAGTLSPPEFFNPDNIGRIMAQAQAARPGGVSTPTKSGGIYPGCCSAAETLMR